MITKCLYRYKFICVCPFLYSKPLYQNGQDFLVIQWFHTCFHSVGLQNNVHCTRRSMVWTASALLSVYTLILDFWLEGAEYIERRNMNTASYCLLHDISSFLSTHFVIALCLHIFFLYFWTQGGHHNVQVYREV